MSDSMDSAASAAPQKTPAQLMQEQHEAEQAADHHATVEDVVDEEDIEHPPPPHATTQEEHAPATNGTMSAKAAGKQKATEKLGVLDTHDEEAFPSLGPASKPAPRAGGWGANSAVKSPKPNGNSSRPSSSGVATPSSTPGMRTPTANARGNVNLPGRFSDFFEIDNKDLDKTKTMKKVLDDAKKKFNVNVSTKPTGFGSRTAFVAEGTKKGSVTDALMTISKQLTVDKTEKLEIPTSASSQIIGKGGANINKLQTQFDVKIQIDKESKTSGPDMATVVIRGHAAGVRQAYEHISNTAKAAQPKVDVSLRDIPPELFPFLAGSHGREIEKMQQDRDLQIDIPQFYRRQQTPPTRAEGQPLFSPHGNSFITMSGDHAAARQAQQELQQLAQQLQEQLILEELTAEQILHPYIVGERGIDPLEFLQRTGCAVILPPHHHDTEEVHIVGPRDRIDAGTAYANELMSKKHNRAVDLQRQFQDAPQGHERHSRALAQYLQQKAIEREFMDSHNAEILFPRHPSAAPSFNVMTDDPTRAMAARNELAKITQAYPTSRLQLVEIDPFFHPHLAERHADPFQDMGVQMIVPDNGEDPVILVYEGPHSDSPFAFPRTKPTPTEIKEFEKALQEAEAQLMASIPHQGISQAELNVPHKHQDRVRKFTSTYPKPQRENSFPVKIDFGRQKRGDQVFLRGPDENDIAELQRAIEQFMIEVEEDEMERSYTTTFDFPSKFNRNLIGKQGQNVNALREKHDVDIDTRVDGKVKIQGPPKKAEACKSEILKTLKQWEDEVNYVIKIDSKFHGQLVGRNGENLRRLQANTNNSVRIDFPRASKMADDASLGDTASEVGGSRQAADEIKIRGPRAKAEQVRNELQDLAAYLGENSHTASVSVDSKQISSLIGRGGAEVEKLRADTGAQIEFPKGEKSAPRQTIQIKGTKQQVEKAKAELQKRAKDFDSVVTQSIDVDRKHHRTLIGQGGNNIQRIVSRAGGTGSSAEHVRFPRQGDESNTLTVKGTQEVVDNILADLAAFVDEKEKQVIEVVDVPVASHRNLIGPNGSNRMKLEKDFGVQINVPRQNSGQTGVKITGQAENVAKAKEHISGSSAGLKGETIQVPRSTHHALDRDGAFRRELSRMGIIIDHEGHKEPKKPSIERQSNGQMPLITDQPTEDVPHSWEILAFTVDEEGEIPWTIYSQRKDEQSIATAKRKIEEALVKASQGQVMGYMTLEDAGLHGRIVGKGGQTINGIRKESGCEVQVPKGRAGGEPITIVGPQEGVDQAYELIMRAILEGQ